MHFHIDMGVDRPDDGSGLHVAEVVQELFPACSIIFVTTYLNFATEVYEVQSFSLF